MDTKIYLKVHHLKVNFDLVIIKRIEMKHDSMVDFIVTVAVNVNIVIFEKRENIDHDMKNLIERKIVEET